MKLKNSIVILSTLLSGNCLSAQNSIVPGTSDLPNILWITSEDNSPLLGCYGDSFATTPNLDRLAAEGFLYTHAYSNAPVCAPTRNSIITGVYACSGGNQHMRSTYPKSNDIKLYPQLLREKGYYCTNNKKEDYNIDLDQVKNIWDERSDTAHYKNRKPGQPFFAIFNTTMSHEHVIHKSIPDDELRHDPKQVTIPAYHPQTEEMKHDWAQYYDCIEDMDTWAGEILAELEEAGLAENTIVFYYSDHGGVLGRSKRFLYESGTHIPFIVRIPEKYKHLFPAEQPGNKINRIISQVDLAPTLLSIANIPIPDYLQGNAFLGMQKTPAPDYAYMFRGRMDERYDMSRALRDHKFRYIRNYMPHRIYGQYIAYLWRAPSMGSWEETYNNGECNEAQSAFWEKKPAEELYDIENDPWEINNLAYDPKYKDVIERMRMANRDWIIKIKDTGFIPEPDRSYRMGQIPAYDYMRSQEVNLEKIVNAAELASTGTTENIPDFVAFLNDEDSAVRYWGATGLLILGLESIPALEELKKATMDPSPSVSIVAAEAVYKLGEEQLAKKVLINKLKKDDFICTFALNAIDALDIQDKKFMTIISDIKETAGQYNLNMANRILNKR